MKLWGVYSFHSIHLSIHPLVCPAYHVHSVACCLFHGLYSYVALIHSWEVMCHVPFPGQVNRSRSHHLQFLVFILGHLNFCGQDSPSRSSSTISSFYFGLSYQRNDKTWALFQYPIRHLIVRSLMKSQSHEIGGLNYHITSKFDGHIDRSAAEVPVKFQSNQAILNTNPVAQRLHEIL